MMTTSTPQFGQLPEAGTLVGAYRLVRKLGEGGMSAVWLALRSDEEIQRRVAIKFVRYGQENRNPLRRLRRERQILASLDHPGIARLHDAGTTADGQPYFVMEYIEGEPITEYCDRHRLTLAERIELFRTVCSTVHYAHQNLVVHRDIKPSNILVTGEGVPKLLDFGIAKLLNPELAGRDLEPTLCWERHLTPEYASPEQVQGKPVSTSSDVYSLGVLLYKLLTGHPPHDFAGRSPRDIERMLGEEEPQKPSSAVSQGEGESVSRARSTRPEALRRRLAGDLDTIVAMAMRKEPQRRYPSAEQFSEDLRRHLEGQPVKARRATFGYRTRKFLRRHRLTMGVAGAFLALLLGAVVGLAVLSIRLVQERDQAQRERDKAKQVVAFLHDIFRVSDSHESRGETITAREVLERAAQRLDRELVKQPQVRATLMDTTGNVYRQLGLYTQAEPLLLRAIEIRQEVLGENEPEVAESLSHLGMLRFEAGDIETAEDLHRRALRIRRAGLGDEHPAVAESLSGLALTLEGRGRYEDAEDLYRQALTIRRQHLGGENHDEVATTLNGLAQVLWEQGRFAEAESLHRQALVMRRALFGPEHQAVAESLNDLALVLKDLENFAEAERLLREALGIHRKILGEDHREVLAGLNNLAGLATRRDDYETAEALYEEALERAPRILGNDHPNIAYLLLGVGSCRTRRGDPQGAEVVLRRAVKIRRRVLGEGHLLTAKAELFLADCLIHLGQYVEAETLLLGSYRVFSSQQPRREREMSRSLRCLVDLYQAWGKPQKAAEYGTRLTESDAAPPPGL